MRQGTPARDRGGASCDVADLACPLAPAAAVFLSFLAVEVEAVDGVVGVGVGVVASADDWVDGQESSGCRVVEADAHE